MKRLLTIILLWSVCLSCSAQNGTNFPSGSVVWSNCLLFEIIGVGGVHTARFDNAILTIDGIPVVLTTGLAGYAATNQNVSLFPNDPPYATTNLVGSTSNAIYTAWNNGSNLLWTATTNLVTATSNTLYTVANNASNTLNTALVNASNTLYTVANNASNTLAAATLAITNGLPTTTLTNGLQLASTANTNNASLTITNGLPDATITNTFALTNLVTSTSNTLAGVQTTYSNYVTATYAPINATITNVTPAISGTYTANVSAASQHWIRMPAGNITIATPTNAVEGSRFMLVTIQDATGSRTCVWPAATVFLWPGGTTPTLSTNANKADTFGFIATNASVFLAYPGGFNQ